MPTWVLYGRLSVAEAHVAVDPEQRAADRPRVGHEMGAILRSDGANAAMKPSAGSFTSRS